MAVGPDSPDIRRLHLGVSDHAVEASLGDHSAEAHHHHPATQLLNNLESVLDDQQSDLLLLDGVQIGDQLVYQMGSYADHRLIQEQDLRLTHQAPHDLHEPALPSAQFGPV